MNKYCDPLPSLFYQHSESRVRAFLDALSVDLLWNVSTIAMASTQSAVNEQNLQRTEHHQEQDLMDPGTHCSSYLLEWAK
eukprot:scaffold7494_cov55-Attheya_sp.AAC.6